MTDHENDGLTITMILIMTMTNHQCPLRVDFGKWDFLKFGTLPMALMTIQRPPRPLKRRIVCILLLGFGTQRRGGEAVMNFDSGLRSCNF